MARQADAHDAGRLRAMGPKRAQLMLMMLADWWPFLTGDVQLMLMMLAVWWLLVPGTSS